jgi:hypothetical protein
VRFALGGIYSHLRDMPAEKYHTTIIIEFRNAKVLWTLAGRLETDSFT